MTVLQNVFSSGELDPLLLARADKPFHKTGLASMENLCPLPLGGLTRRPGTRYLGNALSQNGRLIPFVFSADQTRILEFGNGKMRVWLQNGTMVSSGGTPYEISQPYSDNMIREASFAQSGDTVWIAHPETAPRKLSRYSDTDWRWSVPTFASVVPAPSITHISWGGMTEATIQTFYSYAVTAISAETGQESLPSTPATITTYPISTTFYITLQWTAVSGALCYKVYHLKNGVWGFVGRTTSTSFEDRNVTPDMADTPPEGYPNHFTGSGNYPRHVFFFQQRLGFASTVNKPFTFWLSKTGCFEDFSWHLTHQDDDAVEITLASAESGSVQWVQPDRSSLLFGTLSSEWALQSSGGAALTPTNGYFTKEGSTGSANLPAIPMDSGLIYAQRGGRNVRTLGYRYDTDRYSGQDLSLLSGHLLRASSLRCWARQAAPHSILWALRQDGVLLGLTLLPEQEVTGWHRHTGDGQIKWITTLPSSPDDRLWLLTYRNGVARMEMLELFPTEGDAPRFLDCALLWNNTGEASVFTGLQHLGGKRVGVWADGTGACASGTVDSQGKLTLPAPVRGPVLIGLPYTSRAEFLTPDIWSDQGTTLLHNRRLLQSRFRVRDTMTFEAGYSDWFNVGDRTQNESGISLSPTRRNFDGVVPGPSGMGATPRPKIRITSPTPFTLLAALFSFTPAKGTGKGGEES